MDFKFFIMYKNNSVSTIAASIIKNSLASGNKLNAAPVFFTNVISNNFPEYVNPPEILWYNILVKNKSVKRKKPKHTIR